MRALITVAAAIVLSTAAQAADLGGYSTKDDHEDRYYRKPALWTGFYVGIHGGYAWAEASGRYERDFGDGPVAGFDATHSIDAEGWLAGGQIGFNKQYGKAVLGIEVDGSWTDINHTGSFNLPLANLPGGLDVEIDASLDALGTVRGRLGFLASPALLVYATGGLAIGKTSADLTIRRGGGFPDSDVVRVSGSSGSEYHVGYVVGGGAEWAMGHGWSLKAEYQYIDLGSVDYRFRGTNFVADPDAPHTSDSLRGVDLDLHVVKLGLNYRF
jgi:outer membrane immunogenic protein